MNMTPAKVNKVSAYIEQTTAKLNKRTAKVKQTETEKIRLRATQVSRDCG